MTLNETEIRRTIEILKPDNALFEVRLIDGKWNASGYFTSTDTLIDELKHIRNRNNTNVYLTVNIVKPECYARNQRDKLIEYAAPTTSDADIAGFSYLFIDIDPKRAAGTSSSNEQLEAAKTKTNEIYMFLRGRGWNDPTTALSGNGVHLMYAIGLMNTPENVKLVQSCLLALNMLFSDDIVEVDLKTYNPARICKLYGTRAQKGANTEDRPHRMSRIVKQGTIRQNDKNLLESLASLLPQQEKPELYNNYNPRNFDLDDWIAKHGLKVTKSKWNGGTKYLFDECPFNPQHRGKDAAIVQTSDGKIAFHCFHNSCAMYKWRDLRLMFEPNAYDFKNVPRQQYPNYQNPNYQPVEIKERKGTDGVPVFYTTEEIRHIKAPPEEFLRTGVTIIDNKMRGLKKGFVTCITGLRGSGKSSITTQISIEAAEQGYRVALFSGELTAKHLYKWIILQAAGKHHIQQTQYDNYYQVKSSAEEVISKWLDGKIYVYNNDYGNDFSEIYKRLNKCVADHKVDLVILDNLMALNLSMLEQDKFARQSVFVEILEDFAKAANIHIMFVAHPRKAMGFLRLDDVSGSNDIVNRVDNALIVHRVNEDFKRLSKQMFKWKDDSPLYHCNNVIEICKDRASGNQDVFIPLYFDIPSKRLKNSEYEYRIYGWEEEYAGAGFRDDDF